MPLHGEGGDVEPGKLQTPDVTIEVEPVHLDGLYDFAIEIAGRLTQFGQRGHFKGRVATDFSVGEIADPAGFQDPGFFGREPVGARRKNAAAHIECGGIEFDDGKSAEQILLGIEEIVIVNFGIFAKDPALRAGVGLRRAALDLVAQSVLALVGVRQISTVEDEQTSREESAGKQKRDGEAIEADAAGLERNDFVVLAHHAEGNQHGDQRGEGRELVQKVRHEIAEVVDDDQEGNAVAGDVVEQLKKSECLKQEDEHAHDGEEIVEKAAQQVEINDGVNTGSGDFAGLDTRGPIFSASGTAFSRREHNRFPDAGQPLC